MRNFVTYKLVNDHNGTLKNAIRVACNFWNRFIEPKARVIVRVGAITAPNQTVAIAYAPYQKDGCIYGKVGFNFRYLDSFTEKDVIGTLIHEIGHVLGFGSIEWLYSFDHNSGEFKPEYIEKFPDLQNMLAEVDYGAGTTLVHWDEDGEYNQELMTGWRNNGEYVLPITIEIMNLFGHRVLESLSEKIDLHTLITEIRDNEFMYKSEIANLDIDYYQNTRVAEEIYSTSIEFEDLIELNLPENIWSLIQKGLKEEGYYKHNSFLGKPAQKTKLALEAYLADKEKEKNSKKENELNWMKIAREQIGVKEFEGDADNPDVVKYLKSLTSLNVQAQQNDETAWCSAFVNWCLKESGVDGTNKANARSWLNWGKESETAQEGCIVILWRDKPTSWKGHVGFFIKETKEDIYLLGGNQNDEVNITKYPKKRLLGYRVNNS